MQKGFEVVNLHGTASGVIAVPVIGENGNWWIGNEDTGIKAQGEPGPQGEAGTPGVDPAELEALRSEVEALKNNIVSFPSYRNRTQLFETTANDATYTVEDDTWIHIWCYCTTRTDTAGHAIYINDIVVFDATIGATNQPYFNILTYPLYVRSGDVVKMSYRGATRQFVIYKLE